MKDDLVYPVLMEDNMELMVGNLGLMDDDLGLMEEDLGAMEDDCLADFLRQKIYQTG